MRVDLLDDGFERLLIFRGGVRPLATGMHRVPRRALVDTRFRAVAVLAQPKANLRLRIPDGLEEVDEVILSRLLKTRLHDQEAAVEVIDIQCRSRFADAARVLVQAGGKLGALADSILRGGVGRIRFSNIDRMVDSF